MSERTTKTIVTPNGHNVVVYDYITGGELRRVQALYLENMKASDLIADDKNAATVAMDKVPASLVFKAQELILEMLVVSVDGCEKEKAFQSAMDLHSEDLTVVLNELDQYASGNAGADKKKLPE